MRECNAIRLDIVSMNAADRCAGKILIIDLYIIYKSILFFRPLFAGRITYMNYLCKTYILIVYDTLAGIVRLKELTRLARLSYKQNLRCQPRTKKTLLTGSPLCTIRSVPRPDEHRLNKSTHCVHV